MCPRSVLCDLSLIVLLAGCGDTSASTDAAGGDGATDATDDASSDASVTAADAGEQAPTATPYPTPTNCTSPPHPVACGWGSDSDLDGELDDREESIFDDQGRLVGIKHYSEADLQQTDVFVYDGDELVEHQVHNWDDVVTWRMTFSYDNGWLVEQTRDEGDDDSIEIRQTYERDELGNLLEWTIERADVNDSRFTFLYAEGRLDKVELDNEPYGSIDVTDTFSYFDDGRVRLVEQDTLGNDYVYAYDEDGRSVHSSMDNMVISSWFGDACTPSYTIVSEHFQSPYRMNWTYDAGGDLIGATFDRHIDGEADRVLEVDYSCSPPTPPAGTVLPKRLGGSMPHLPEFPELFLYDRPPWERLRPTLDLLHEPVIPNF